MSLIVNEIENFLEARFDLTFDHQYSLLSVGYFSFYVYQFALLLTDAVVACFQTRKIEKTDNLFFLFAFFLFSAVYGLLFTIVEPQNRRIFSACGILTTVKFVLSAVYLCYVFLTTDLLNENQLLYYTHRFAPISMLFMTFLVVLSVLVFCKMSFFRPYTKVITDLYEIEEKDGKKAV